jgi:hypothetical protein
MSMIVASISAGTLQGSSAGGCIAAGMLHGSLTQRWDNAHIKYRQFAMVLLGLLLPVSSANSSTMCMAFELHTHLPFVWI